jgi:hypothetical protein
MEKLDENTTEAKQFSKTIADIHTLANKMDKGMETMIKADENWFYGAILKLLK